MSTMPEHDPLQDESATPLEPEQVSTEPTLPWRIEPDHAEPDQVELASSVPKAVSEFPQTDHSMLLTDPMPQTDLRSEYAPSYSGVWEEPEVKRYPRIPHFGHVFLLFALAAVGLIAAGLIARVGLHLHLFGVRTLTQATTDIHYTLGTMALLYLITFALAWMIFPLFWNRSFLAGLQWNAAALPRYRGRLFAAACVCFVLAMIDEVVLPGPTNAPIDELFKTRTAAWLLFAFGVTVAPLFEEIIFRGFLLPAFCTAYDWTTEKLTGRLAPPLGPNDAPRWSLAAMVVGSILTSIPFAAMHGEQTGYSLGPFVLLVCVSMVLCLARLGTRSLACSVFVHASYNFLLFSLMLIGTGGFRHLDKM
jgi:CAAX protease family protein